MALILLFGSYASELQTRVAFFNWLVTSRKVATLEEDLHVFKTKNKISTTADITLDYIKACSVLANKLSEIVEEKTPELVGHFSFLRETMQGCISHITNSTNLYSVPQVGFSGKLDNEMDVINAYVTRGRASSFGSLSSLLSKPFGRVKTVRSRSFNAGFKEFMSILPSNVHLEEKIDLDNLRDDWNFPMISYFNNTNQAFLSVGYALLSGFREHYNLPEEKLLKFLSLVDGLYSKSTAYHNSMHAAFVAHKIYCLANYIGIYDVMSVLDRSIIIVAALCHDIGHPGRNNTFFINSQHPVAQLFNDRAVLENFHSCCTFNILEIPECNIFADFSADEYKVIRRKLIELILATDMEDHFEIVSKFSLRKNSPEFSKDDEEDLDLISKVLIKAADLSSGIVSWDESFEWSQRILYEFYDQGDEEIRLGLPVGALCDRKRHNEVAKSQYTFLKLVVSPIFEELAALNPGKIKGICIKQLDENAKKWQDISESGEEIPLLNLERELQSGTINIAWAMPNRE
ncbi:3'5'-cyclic nucleotide phosphodiesterase family protein [Theileria equi strain WA]|uniref:Phosphodiesterase n=1 Tax=Theileria equi strain WA TaxID=1537102 RepID=L1LG16_THEEQ|nr:3'5'-cyclic nucleotide phosphodiesterase family protein [Theileria equi strain WA]EKX74377.1 3'5'-cyclic nucleotide phosphodiesterase family protein [Theileria equi strain WA]|eukprot:XP_004833829.1 3'5'-cyclic nucleotide phosphodiesterase family protein [Theileria equi strain WA]